MSIFKRFLAGVSRRGAIGAPHANPTVRSIFAQASHNEALARDGVAIIQWLSPEEIEGLNRIVREAADGVDFDDVHIPTPFRLSAFVNDATYKSNLYDKVYAFLAPQLEALLPGYVPLVVNVFEKQVGDQYDPVNIHQNPSFVSEPEHKSVSIWIPLQDVTRQNGTVGVLRGSHERFNLMRAGNMYHEHIFALVERKLEDDYFEPLDMKAGEVAVLDDSIIHWSYPNVSDGVRTAVQLIMVPRAADHIYYFYNETGPRPMMDLYEVDKDFFFHFNCKELPDGLKKIGSVPYEYTQVTDKQLRQAR